MSTLDSYVFTESRDTQRGSGWGERETETETEKETERETEREKRVLQVAKS